LGFSFYSGVLRSSTDRLCRVICGVGNCNDLGLPISWKRSLAQYAGRIHRLSESKDRVTIYDYLDSSLPTLERMFNRRAKAYEALGYAIVPNEESIHVQGNLSFSSQ
jgi:hypothetical protein